MLECEGFRMFRGSALVTPACQVKPFRVQGTWLYRPDFDYWYVAGHSYSPKIISDIQEDEA